MIALLLIILVCTLVLWKYLNGRKFKDVDKIPGPRPLPIIGNVLEFGRNPSDCFEAQMRLHKTYGRFIRVWLGSRLSIILSDAEKVEYILSSSVHTIKSKNYDNFKYWLGNGILISKGNYWKKHRKIITPAFHFKILEQFSEYIYKNGNILIDKMKQGVNKSSTEIYPLLKLYAIDVITESAMKARINAQTNAETDYVKAVKGYLDIYISNFFSLYKWYEPIFKLTQDYKLQQEHVKVLKGFSENVLNLRKEMRAKNPNIYEEENEFGEKPKKVFLDLLLDLQSNENLLTDSEIREELDSFIFAGHDTVSTAVAFALFELAKYPEIQERLVEESNNVLGEDANIELTFKQINELKYLDLVFKECLRLYPSVPFIERELHEDIVFDGISIPKGTTIQILIYAMHRDAKYFPDPDKFDPDRFLPENTRDRNPFAYIPFSAGSRNCIGIRYAQLFSKSTILNVLRHFKLRSVVPEFKPVLSNNAVLESVNGLPVQLLPRKPL